MMRGELLAGGARAGRGAAAAQAARARRTQLEARHGGGERTSKMLVMSVTLDVLKYTGWLNRSAFCQAGKEGVRRGARCRPEGAGARAWGSGGASGAAEGSTGEVAAGHGRSARRTCRTCS